MEPTILVLQGPNLNRLGRRDPARYGVMTLEQMHEKVEAAAAALHLDIVTAQSNHEGALVDRVHEHQDAAQAVICNPAGLTPYGYSLRDALVDSKLPVAIVHISNHFRFESTPDIFAAIADYYVAGLGWQGYVTALQVIDSAIRRQGP